MRYTAFFGAFWLLIHALRGGNPVWPLVVVNVAVIGIVLGSIAFAIDGSRASASASGPLPLPAEDQTVRYLKWIAAFMIGRIAVSPFGGAPSAFELLVLVPAMAVIFARARIRSEWMARNAPASRG